MKLAVDRALPALMASTICPSGRLSREREVIRTDDRPTTEGSPATAGGAGSASRIPQVGGPSMRSEFERLLTEPGPAPLGGQDAAENGLPEGCGIDGNR
jgi:hypothetical protein